MKHGLAVTHWKCQVEFASDSSHSVGRSVGGEWFGDGLVELIPDFCLGERSSYLSLSSITTATPICAGPKPLSFINSGTFRTLHSAKSAVYNVLTCEVPRYSGNRRWKRASHESLTKVPTAFVDRACISDVGGLHGIEESCRPCRYQSDQEL